MKVSVTGFVRTRPEMCNKYSDYCSVNANNLVYRSKGGTLEYIY